MTDRRFCKQPDRHEPRMKCGYPLPCPYHTVVVTARELGLAVDPKKKWPKRRRKK